MRSSILLVVALIAVMAIGVSARVHHRPGSHHTKARPKAASSATLTVQSYATLTCNSSVSPPSQVEYQTGTCYGNSYVSTTQYFCDTEYAYTVQYGGDSSVGCELDNVVSVQRNPLNTCQSGATVPAGGSSPPTFTTTSYYACQNSQNGPALPFSFPPSQSVVTATCSLPGSSEIVCAGTSGAVCTQVSVKANICVQSYGEQTSISNSTQVFVTEDGTYLGVASYSDWQCEVQTATDLVAMSCESQNVNSGSYATSGATTLPSSSSPVPSMGLTLFGNDECTGVVSQVHLQTPDVCYKSNVFTCDENNSLVVASYKLDDTTCLGEIMFTQALTVDECLWNGAKPVCSFSP